MRREARYDGVAAWYDASFSSYAQEDRSAGLLGRVVGEIVDAGTVVLDVGCGTGLHFAALQRRGLQVVGVDVSMDQLRLASSRSTRVVRAGAAQLPFASGSLEVAVATFVHTDVDDFAAMTREVARLLRTGGRFVYIGTHPCFIGPFLKRSLERESSELLIRPGYGDTDLVYEGSGTSRGLFKAKVGARNLSLGVFLGAFLDAGLAIDRLDELDTSSRPWAQDRTDGTIVPWNVLVIAAKR